MKCIQQEMANPLNCILALYKVMLMLGEGCEKHNQRFKKQLLSIIIFRCSYQHFNCPAQKLNGFSIFQTPQIPASTSSIITPEFSFIWQELSAPQYTCIYIFSTNLGFIDRSLLRQHARCISFRVAIQHGDLLRHLEELGPGQTGAGRPLLTSHSLKSRYRDFADSISIFQVCTRQAILRTSSTA